MHILQYIVLDFQTIFLKDIFEYCMPFAIIKFIMKLRAQIALTGL